MAAPRWLLLAHQLPARPSHARVKTWRRLQQIGAVPTRNSVYVLPNTPQCREDFEWIRSEIVAAGGEATVFAADVVDTRDDKAIVAAFRRSRETCFAAFVREVTHLDRATRRAHGTAGARLERFRRAVRALRDRFAELERIDFYHAPGRQVALRALTSLERRIAEVEPVMSIRTPRPLAVGDFRARHWVTRPRPGVDRMASAWLIRRFIDPKATFGFVEHPSESDVPFDMYVGEFSHQGPLCTFETLTQRFSLGSPVVDRVGQIVHDLDMKESRYGLPEQVAIGRMVEGLRQVHPDDGLLLEQGVAMFEALARAFESDTAGSEAPRSARRKSTGKRPRRSGKKTR